MKLKNLHLNNIIFCVFFSFCFHFLFIYMILKTKVLHLVVHYSHITCFILFKSSEAVKTDYRNEDPSEAVIPSWFVEHLPQKKVGIFLEKYLFWRPILMKSQGNLCNFTGTGLQCVFPETFQNSYPLGTCKYWRTITLDSLLRFDRKAWLCNFSEHASHRSSKEQLLRKFLQKMLWQKLFLVKL